MMHAGRGIMVSGRLALTNLVAASVLAVFCTGAGAADMTKSPPPPLGPLGWDGFYAGGNIGSEDGDGVSGAFGGFQAGYNHRIDSKFLIGAEGELSWGSQSRWFDTLDARLGYVLGPWLLYVKGGGAWTNNSDGSSSTHTGFSVGGGVEYMFARNWSAKAEYEHLDFGSDNIRGGDSQVNEFKVGVNYHFAPGTLFGLK
jgi:outer membrane immunogenic protein